MFNCQPSKRSASSWDPIARKLDIHGDGGIDLDLLYRGVNFFIQCKDWASRKVGVEVIRSLESILLKHPGGVVCLVTNAVLSDEAKREVSNCFPNTGRYIIVGNENTLFFEIEKYCDEKALYEKELAQIQMQTQAQYGTYNNEINDIEIVLDNEEVNIMNFISVKGNGNCTIKIANYKYT